MARMVGFAVSLKLEWLVKAAELNKEGIDEATYKSCLNDYLRMEIKSETRLRKTREILMRIWYYDGELASERKHALMLLERYPEESVAVHYCLICRAFPVFADICSYIGNMLRFRDDITNAMLSKKLYDEWGERGTLETTARRVSLTLKNLELIKMLHGNRYVTAKISIKSEEITAFIVETVLKISGDCHLSALTEVPMLFPFLYRIDRGSLSRNPNLSMTMLGGEFSIAIKH